MLFKLKENAFRKRESFKEKAHRERASFREKFQFYVSKSPPLSKKRINPTQVGHSDYFRGADQTFSDVWMHGWVAPNCLLTSALGVKATQGPK